MQSSVYRKATRGAKEEEKLATKPGAIKLSTVNPFCIQETVASLEDRKSAANRSEVNERRQEMAIARLFAFTLNTTNIVICKSQSCNKSFKFFRLYNVN